MANLRVVVADDQTLMREAVRIVLEAEDGMTVVGEAASGAALLVLLKRVDADVALVDLAMPPLDGIELLERIRSEHPAIKAVVLSGTDDPRHVAAALRRGAAFVLKSVNPSDLDDRKLWDKFSAAYEIMLDKCSTAWAPWHVIPADRKWARNAAIGAIVRETLEEMNPQYPKPAWDPKSFVIK